MTIHFARMTGPEIANYVTWLIDDYAKDVARNYQLPMVLAQEESTQLIRDLFPDNQPGEGQTIVHVMNGDPRVGILWYAFQAESKRIFIYHILIEETYRGQGYATAVFEILEKVVSEELGATSIGLSVFGTNPNAQRLYKRLGFQEASIAMNKQL
ncbi:N-acetyltransferase [Exiguobacterium sp. s140]|jgi:ribosomal protein S18 acetylase RimI-like enzyme|uniref:GNAT family N-acetyltransferase n=1 Tax=Exiguobacterium sp. s140 TaxID=2751290 RepID=UPI001BE96D16|nr:N-acetyltransferase [Exiguobacterium sp. s140]